MALACAMLCLVESFPIFTLQSSHLSSGGVSNVNAGGDREGPVILVWGKMTALEPQCVQNKRRKLGHAEWGVGAHGAQLLSHLCYD